MMLNIIHHYHHLILEVKLEILDHHIHHKVILHIVQYINLELIHKEEKINNMNKNNENIFHY